MMLRRENDNLIELGEIREEIVNTWTFGCAPAMLTLKEVVNGIGRETRERYGVGLRTKVVTTLLTSQVLVTNKSSIDSNKV